MQSLGVLVMVRATKKKSQATETKATSPELWDVVCLIARDSEAPDHVATVLSGVPMQKAVDYVERNTAPDMPCIFAIWPCWAYTPTVGEDCFVFAEMLADGYANA
jgi:hypothetical protein